MPLEAGSPRRGELGVLFFFSPHYLVLSKYVNLKERPPFNLEAALAEHSSRDRKTELERAKKVTLSSRKAEAKLLRSEAGGEKKKQKRCAADCDDDDDDDDDDEDDDYDEDEEAEIEMEDAENKKALDRMRDEDSDNFSSEDSNVASSLFQQRSASKRQIKMSAKLEEHSAVVEELEVAEEKEQARAKTVKEKVVKKAVVSKAKVPAKKVDLKRDKIVGKAEVKVAKNVKSVAKNAKSVKSVKSVKDKTGVKKVVDAEKVAGTGIFQLDLKSLTTRNDKLSIFVVDEYMSLLERADNFPASILLLGALWRLRTG